MLVNTVIYLYVNDLAPHAMKLLFSFLVTSLFSILVLLLVYLFVLPQLFSGQATMTPLVLVLLMNLICLAVMTYGNVAAFPVWRRYLICFCTGLGGAVVTAVISLMIIASIRGL